jgi:CheY-like chemotaxis protein
MNQPEETMVDKNAVDILLIEDNAADIELTVRALDRHHLANKVFVVKDGAEALDFIFCRGVYFERPKSNLPKVIFLDLKLPKVDGMEVLRAIRAEESTKMVPVVVFTSSLEERDLIESYELGVNSYIAKPVEFDKFVEAVSEAGLYWMLINKPPYKN